LSARSLKPIFPRLLDVTDGANHLHRACLGQPAVLANPADHREDRLTARRNTSLIRVCQPGPPVWADGRAEPSIAKADAIAA
jgi:hypothetical protein